MFDGDLESPRYAVSVIDLFGIYCGEIDRSFLVPSQPSPASIRSIYV
jgi:hypothetical protein